MSGSSLWVKISAPASIAPQITSCRPAQLAAERPCGRKLQFAAFVHSLRLLHNPLNRNRFQEKIMQQFKVLQRPWRV
ncbi:hypothetical protein EHI47_32385 [Rhizobium leguminosarum]|uniref:Uncharacterized protein n=2 Tax=Rhizobium TaxID=379 RepID=A0A444HLJ0_RHILE|nr:hypothetical protein [Rhizobium leguminosarum bv. viciae]RWX02760.1 hypothetical protein EHI45_35175 [Rhizobium leguminosarum]TBE71455.1 hypothetical protein ELH03_12220 [Rhizobium beringeri]RWX22872.1 hypothetical protein EHI47_32385 [Rhizobium leguminosarum]TBC73584.1 hypothetical protein ELH27_12340 [Rhizobium leguminosarum]